MNRLPGRIAAMETSGELSLVDVEVGGDVLEALALETPGTGLRLAPGRPVAILFKETEVILAPADPGPSSLRNRLPCRVLGREAGRILTHVRLDYRGTVLHALAPTRAVEALGLVDGGPAVALIQAAEVALEGAGP